MRARRGKIGESRFHCNEMSEDTQVALIPLAAAAIIVHKEATGRIATDPDALNPVAASIARHVPIYARKCVGKTLEMIRAQVLEGAVFRDCGKLMRSRDIAYTDLCLRRSDIPLLVEKLTRSGAEN